MIKKVYIILQGIPNESISETIWKIESNFLSWKMKNSVYEYMLEKAFIDKYWKDNVVSCRLMWKWEYKNIFRHKCYNWNFFMLFRELRKNRKNSIFMFHGVMFPWLLFYALIPAAHKCRWRHTIIWPYNKSENKLKWIALWIIQKFFQNFIDTIFCVNDNEVKELMNYKYKWNKFFLPIPINTEFWKKHYIDADLKCCDDKDIYHITCTGAICIRKNQKIILDAINLLKVRSPHLKFEVDLIGRTTDDKYKNFLDGYTSILKINIPWGKTASDLKQIYKKTDIYIQPSFSEWLCQTYIEACISWCPLILSNIPTFTDTAKDCALFFNPYDANDLAEKILYMINHLDEYREKSKKLAVEFEKFWYDSFNKQFNEFINMVK